MQKYVIGRQAILGRDLEVKAYELLYRNGPFSAVSYAEATQQVITDLLLEHGISEMVGEHKAFINLTRENLLDPGLHSLPKGQIVLEILEDVEIDEQLIEAVRSLSKEGFTIALDDFVFSPEWEPLIDLANIIKLDLRIQTRKQNKDIINQLKGRKVKFLAEKVESQEEFQFFYDLGCDYFQGFFFCEPSLIKGTKLSANQSATLRLLSEINNPNAQPDSISNVIQQDIGLSHKLLKYMNSAYFSLPQKIGSIKHAIVLLGLAEIKRWATLIAMSNNPDKPSQLMSLSLQRAKMCELLAEKMGEEETASYFLVGLFSTLDAILDVTMETALEKLHLSEQATNALLYKEGKAGRFLKDVIFYQKWELESVDCNLDLMSDAFLESIRWEKGVHGF